MIRVPVLACFLLYNKLLIVFTTLHDLSEIKPRLINFSINLIQIRGGEQGAAVDLEIPEQPSALMDGEAQHERGSNPRQTSSKSWINLTFHRDCNPEPRPTSLSFICIPSVPLIPEM